MASVPRGILRFFVVVFLVLLNLYFADTNATKHRVILCLASDCKALDLFQIQSPGTREAALYLQ